MLEDSTMDKKSAGRSNQLPCKGNGTDLKKSQDASSSSKSFPKGPRKREGSNASSNIPKYEQSKKCQSQKSRSFDKRSRARGQYPASGKEDSKVEEQGSHDGSVVAPGSKKVSLNHLLNFHYSPKDGGRANSGTSPRWLHNSQRHKYNKEQFLQANCQFVVKAEGDYTRYLHDPDMLVEWSLIEQIRVQSCELLSCPICLSSPTAARMTRCGHIYCWPCMLHYLALADKAWRKCPICYEAVHRDDLKSVVALQHAELSVGNMVTMRLMRRERGTLLVVPVEGANSSSTRDTPVSVAESSTNTLYCKLLLATPSQVLEMLQEESRELEERRTEELATPEVCFTEQALELLAQRQGPLHELAGRQPAPPLIQEKEVEPQSHIHAVGQSALVYKSAFDNELQEDAALAQRERYESVSSEGRESEVASPLPDEDATLITAEDLEITSSQPSKYFYFYQADDGQHLYLHAVNARMLEAMYGSLEHSPTLLQARIVQKEAGSMTAELRLRLRYLQHLPVTCQFEVAELDLRPPLVSRAILHHFQEQLEQRRRTRQRRARDERRREKRINEEENKRYGRYPTPHISIASHTHFPECGFSVSPPLLSEEAAGWPSTTHPQFPPMEEMKELSLHDEAAAGGPSFAQMLREGKCQQRPVLPVVRRQTQQSDNEAEPEGYVPAPAFSQSFGDAFALALERAASKGEGSEAAPSNRKKKKNKQKVLFSTGMACNSK